jgi:GT2 family glycosyltransferase
VRQTQEQSTVTRAQPGPAVTRPHVVAVVLNWNRPDDTIACLDSLAQQSHRQLRTVVVDNGSDDDSVARIVRAHPSVTLIAHPENSGFSRGINLGIREALAQGADYVFILNNDTTLATDALAVLVAGAGENPAAPIIYYAGAPRRVWSLGGRFNPWLLEVKGSLRGLEDRGQWPALITVDFVPACALLVPSQIFEEIGYFDERFFMYYEDLDFCLRLHHAGRPIRILTQAKVWHAVSRSSGGSDSRGERYWMARAGVLYFRKHARPWQWPLIGFWRLGSAVRTSVRLLRQRNRAGLGGYWRGLWAGMRQRT